MGNDRPRADCLPIGGVIKSLLFDLCEVLPDDDAGPGVDELEGIEDVIADPAGAFGGGTVEATGEEEVGALELDQVRVTSGGDLTGLLELLFLFESGHAFAGEEEDLAAGLGIESCADAGEEDVLVDGEAGVVLDGEENDPWLTLSLLDLRGLKDAAGHFVGDRDDILGFDAGAGDESLFVGLEDGDAGAGRVADAGRSAAGEKDGGDDEGDGAGG